MKRLGVALLSILIIIVFMCASYLSLTYIDQGVSTGQAYALTIGQTKDEVYQRLPQVFTEMGVESNEIFIEVLVNVPGDLKDGGRRTKHKMMKFNIESLGSNKFHADDQWIFYVGPTHRNFLRLNFCDGTLCRIYRHRKYFDLP